MALIEREEETTMAELKSCPFCGAASEMHIVDSSLQETRRKQDVPKGARILRTVTYKSGAKYYEYYVKEYVPRCTDTSCIGRCTKRYKTEFMAQAAWNRRADNGTD